jgi:hypothetical protein
MKTLLAVAVLVVSSVAAADPVKVDEQVFAGNDWFWRRGDGRWFKSQDHGNHWIPVPALKTTRPLKAPSGLPMWVSSSGR